MSNGLISFLAAAATATWLFSKLQRRTGAADTRQSAVLAAMAGGLIFVAGYLLLGALFE